MASKGPYAPIKDVSQQHSYLMPNTELRGIGQPYAKATDYFQASALLDPYQVAGSSLSAFAIPNPITDRYVQFSDGLVSGPAVTWANETNSGRYRIGAGSYGESILGTNVATWNASGLALAAMTQGSVLFAGASGQISQNNSSLFWDNTNKALTCGGPDTAGGPTRIHNYGITNTFCGYNAGNFTLTAVAATSGFSNTGFGVSALSALTTGYNNAAFGFALPVCTSGYQNIALGDDACHVLTDGHDNVCVGFNTLNSNIHGNFNVAIGNQALEDKTTNPCTAVGYQALLNDVSGSGNTSMGYQSQRTLTVGNGNSAFGDSALYTNASSFNTAMGYFALQLNDTGQKNTALGYFSGYTSTAANANVSGSSNTWVGYSSGPSSTTQVSGTIAIGVNALVSASNMCVIGGSGSDAVSVVIGGGTTAAKRLEVIDSSAAQLRLTQTAGSVFADLQQDSSGNFSITNTGGSGIFFVAASAVFKAAGTAANQLLSHELWDNGVAGTREGRMVYAGTGGVGNKYFGLINDAASYMAFWTLNNTDIIFFPNSTESARLTNAGFAKFNVKANGQNISLESVTELTTIAAAATTDTAIQIPLDAVVFGVTVRVTVVIPTAVTFTVTGTTSATQFDVAGGVAVAAGTTDVGTRNCPYKNGAAQTIRITPSAVPAANTGRVRVTIHYYKMTPPTS